MGDILTKINLRWFLAGWFSQSVGVKHCPAFSCWGDDTPSLLCLKCSNLCCRSDGVLCCPWDKPTLATIASKSEKTTLSRQAYLWVFSVLTTSLATPLIFVITQSFSKRPSRLPHGWRPFPLAYFNIGFLIFDVSMLPLTGSILVLYLVINMPAACWISCICMLTFFSPWVSCVGLSMPLSAFSGSVC